MNFKLKGDLARFDLALKYLYLKKWKIRAYVVLEDQ